MEICFASGEAWLGRLGNFTQSSGCHLHVSWDLGFRVSCKYVRFSDQSLDLRAEGFGGLLGRYERARCNYPPEV